MRASEHAPCVMVPPNALALFSAMQLAYGPECSRSKVKQNGSEGAEVASSQPHPTRHMIGHMSAAFTGMNEQKPAAFAAAHVVIAEKPIALAAAASMPSLSAHACVGSTASLSSPAHAPARACAAGQLFVQKSADPQITFFLYVGPFLFVYLLLAITNSHENMHP